MASFEIDGREYEIPSVMLLNMGEAAVLYDYCGYVIEDFVPPAPGESDEKRLTQIRNPRFKSAMVHIAYQRQHPELARQQIEEVVAGVSILEVTAALYAGDDEDPTETSQTEPPSSSEPDGTSTAQSSGRRSHTSSDEQAPRLVPTGTTG